jgi:hypothetical protein
LTAQNAEQLFLIHLQNSIDIRFKPLNAIQ